MSPRRALAGAASVRLAAEYALILALAVLALGPIAVIAMSSFDVSAPGAPFRAGVAVWRGLFADSGNFGAMLWSLALAVRVPIGLGMALISVWIMVRLDAPGARLFEYLFWFAFFLPALPMLSGWILLLDPDYGLLNRLALASGLWQRSAV